RSWGGHDGVVGKLCGRKKMPVTNVPAHSSRNRTPSATCQERRCVSPRYSITGSTSAEGTEKHRCTRSACLVAGSKYENRSRSSPGTIGETSRDTTSSPSTASRGRGRKTAVELTWRRECHLASGT